MTNQEDQPKQGKWDGCKLSTWSIYQMIFYCHVILSSYSSPFKLPQDMAKDQLLHYPRDPQRTSRYNHFYWAQNCVKVKLLHATLTGKTKIWGQGGSWVQLELYMLSITIGWHRLYKNILGYNPELTCPQLQDMALRCLCGLANFRFSFDLICLSNYALIFLLELIIFPTKGI